MFIVDELCVCTIFGFAGLFLAGWFGFLFFVSSKSHCDTPQDVFGDSNSFFLIFMRLCGKEGSEKKKSKGITWSWFKSVSVVHQNDGSAEASLAILWHGFSMGSWSAKAPATQNQCGKYYLKD